MGSAIKSLAIVAVAGVALTAVAGLQAFADEGQYVRPAHGLMLDVGSKHTVSYFLTDGSKCNLTLMIGDKANDEGDNSSVGARINVAVEAGKSARVETAEGKSLEFACAGGASAMNVRALDVVAYTPATK